MPKFRAWRPVVMSMLMFGACGEDTLDPLATARLEVVAGQEQTSLAGGVLAQPVSVRVLTSAGQPMPGVTVDWVILEGGGSVDPAASITDANGIAMTRWRLGDAFGVQALLARTRTASARVEAFGRIEFTDVTAGFRHSCALTTGGHPFCWGLNDRGQLGLGFVSPAEPPAVTTGDVRFKSIAAGWFHTCGLTESGDAYCWGDNSVGQLGSPGTTAAAPRRVASNEAFAALSAGYQHTCAINVRGEAFCWGSDDFGALGVGRTTSSCFNSFAQRCTAVPQRVVSAVSFTRIAAGEFHTCAIGLDGAPYCWGSNSNGQIGNLGANPLYDVPTRSITNRGYAFIDAGARHNCAITGSERMECWGRNVGGEIGVSAGTALSAPNPLPSTLQFRGVDVGETHSCGLGADQRAYCWGSLLGNGTANSSAAPVQADLTGNVRDVAAGGDHSCAVVETAVWCWGSNSDRQLGVSSPTRSAAPVRIEVGQ